MRKQNRTVPLHEDVLSLKEARACLVSVPRAFPVLIPVTAPWSSPRLDTTIRGKDDAYIAQYITGLVMHKRNVGTVTFADLVYIPEG